MFAHSFTHFTLCMALGSDGPKINTCKEPAPDVLLDMLEAAHIQPAFEQWCGRGNILSNWQKPAWLRQAGGPACWLGEGQEGVQGSHYLLVIAGGKQELWPAHAHCLLSSASSEVLSPFTQPPWSTRQKSWGKVIREWSRPLNDTDISSPFRKTVQCCQGQSSTQDMECPLWWLLRENRASCKDPYTARWAWLNEST